MAEAPFTSLTRVVTALQHREADRVPFFLLLTIHGARLLGMSIKDYFSRPEHIADAQIRMRERYGHDCLYGFAYASLEVEAFGGSTIFFDDGPPNAGAPVVRTAADIRALAQPDILNSPLRLTLEAQAMMKARIGDEAPVIGVVISPFSLPVMQMGFEPYLELLLTEPELYAHLMAVNERFCVDWANAQVEAGATAIVYFDPVSSPTVITPDQFRRTGLDVAKRVLPQIKAPTAYHFASGRALDIIADLPQTGTAAVATCVHEDLAAVKASAGPLSVVGNLNAIEMRRWTDAEAEAKVKEAIAKAGRGGGFILSDNHGEIPWQVPETVLDAISSAVHTWGRYPLDWVDA
ncbi:MAG: uroporphyrinogen decarboxylase family protein [Alphaproteobacteria bacterium]|nr:uroporphyrinogen decarboxylase family protein [Alphaproteobacteria bacterium]